MLACRNCRIPVTAADGCAVCTPIKRHLVQVGEQDEERPSLSDVGSEIVAELRYALKQSKRVTHDESATAKDRILATALVLKIGNTAAKVLEAARKLQTDGLAAVRNMSFVERAKLFIDWYVHLPPSYRDNIRSQQEKFEERTNRALPHGEAVPAGEVDATEDAQDRPDQPA